MGFEAVVQIGGVIGDLVHEIDELRFKRRSLIETVLGEKRKISNGVILGMFDDSLADFEGQVQAREIEIALLKPLDDPRCMEIVLEAVAVLAHAEVELTFAGVPERGMSDVVDERERFGELRVEAESPGDRTRDLRDLERVRQPVAEMVRITRGEDLGLRLEAPEGPRM